MNITLYKSVGFPLHYFKLSTLLALITLLVITFSVAEYTLLMVMFFSRSSHIQNHMMSILLRTSKLALVK